MSKSKETIDNFTPPKRYWKGQKKTEKAIAPWSGSTFETEYNRQQKLTEYTGVFHPIEVKNNEKIIFFQFYHFLFRKIAVKSL